ncbi:putative mitochondrial carrier [Smittium mucronatum]|uniref:Putative mitochondrial carrier n=1 Tax=Smittium mucronatum TaxID=133383 RepID=A0A1R0H8S4_9FUNG|nr:putative mitochondrial carrier [Smittium mucronatum]
MTDSHISADMSNPIRQNVLDVVAGSFGGIGQVLAGQPFDTIKVRLQTQPQLYSGTLDCIKKLIKSDGFMGLYKGTTSPLMGVGLCVSIQFFTLEHMKRSFRSKNNGLDLDNSQLFLAGSVAGLTNSVVSGPVEHIRTRLQVQSSSIPSTSTPGNGPSSNYAGTFDAIRKIYTSHGLAGIYKGQVPTLIREFFGYGFYFSAYEYLVQNEMKNTGRPRDQISNIKICLFGSAAGFAMWLTCYPIDTIKSKIQTDGFSGSKDRKYFGVVDCLRKTVRAEGIAGLFRGIVPCLLRAAPANASTFICFEFSMRMLQKYF